MSGRPTIPARACALLIRFYKAAISPAIHLIPGSGCRFHPTCSQYALEAVLRFGAARGCIMGACRILRCNPFCKGGFDYVPERFTWSGLFSSNPEPPKKVDGGPSRLH